MSVVPTKNYSYTLIALQSLWVYISFFGTWLIFYEILIMSYTDVRYTIYNRGMGNSNIYNFDCCGRLQNMI